MKTRIIILFMFVSTSILSQDITMTLGANGILKVWDGSSTFLTLRQTDGQLNPFRSMRLENTIDGSGTGVIFKGYDSFIHDYLPAPYVSSNTFVGLQSGNFSMSYLANYNTAFGKLTLRNNSSGSHNTAIGSGSLSLNNTGNNNTTLGSGTMQNNTSGSNNTAIGFYSMSGNQYGSNNTGVGAYTLFSSQNNSYYNNAVGSYSMYSNSSGYRNNAMGYQSLYYNTTGRYNTAIGDLAMLYNSTGYENTSVGAFSLLSNSSGYYNVAVGNGASYNISTGFHNTAIGWYAGYNLTTGSNNILIGSYASSTSPTVSGQITLGGGFITQLRCNVTSITSLSDSRDKKNINDLTLGLDFITKLKPRQFNWDKREWYENNITDGSKMQETPTAGFIAQELDEAQTNAGAEWLNLVLKDNPEKWEATPGNLFPVMVKAIQELKAENDELKTRIESFRTIEERLARLEETLNQNSNSVNVKLAEEK